MGTSGQRSSAEAIARDREKSRERARLRRERQSEIEHEISLANRRAYEKNNRDDINERRRLRYGADIDRLAIRPFIMWDGEGYTDDKGEHHYMLFGCSMHRDSPLVGRHLGTKACLDYILGVESLYPDAFHVGFVFDYDVNMILGDLEARHLRHLADYGMVHWGPYRIKHIPGKVFQVSKGNPKRGELRLTATIFDMFGFFHSKYTTSIIKFGVRTREEIELVEKGKDQRPDFTFDDIDFVKKYWQAEIEPGPMLADCIREACYDAGLYVTQWHGPGALAAYILRKRGVNQWHSKDVPHEVQIATRYAYAGGRFQAWRCGLYHHRVYTADINSAYIYACSLLPRLDNGTWIREGKGQVDRDNIKPFALYHIAYDAGTDKQRDNRHRGAFNEIYPLFHRDRNGSMFWPARTEGWYWGPEAALVASDPNARFLEAWIYRDDGTRPFGWVHQEFDKRLVLQHSGNPAEKTFKWALAAMYGAFARTVGWDKKKRQPPRSHELSWAGFITSWCRAEMYSLAYHVWRIGGLISIDTDGVTSTVPFEPEWLKRGIGEKLGEWKLEEYAGIMYWQSGFYWLLDDDGEWSTAKTRGIKRGSLDVEVALQAYADADYQATPPVHAIIEKKGTRFIGYKEALKRKNGMREWRNRWVEFPTKSMMGRAGTGIHAPHFCIKCRRPNADTMHVITHFPPRHVESTPHYLPWLDEQDEWTSNMTPLDKPIYWDSDEVDELLWNYRDTDTTC